MNIYPAYISKHNSAQIMKNKSFFSYSKWRKIALHGSKKLSALLSRKHKNMTAFIQNKKQT